MHVFEKRPVSTCAVCGVVRVVKVKGPLYAYSSDDDSWSSHEPPCLTDEQSAALVETAWKKKPIAMFDVETTGLDWASDLITEVAVVVGVLTEDGTVDVRSSYTSLIKLPLEYQERVSKTAEITGITFEMLEREGKDATVVTEEVLEVLSHFPDAIGAAYNGRFDQPFLNALYLRHGRVAPSVIAPSVALVDPLVWVRRFDKYVPGKGRHKLTTTAIRHGVIQPEEAEKAHRADFDALVALGVLAKLADRVPDDLEDLRDFERASDAEWAKEFFGDFLPSKRRQERLARLRASAC